MPCYNPTRVVMEGDQRINFSKDYKVARFFDGDTVVNLPCRDCNGCSKAKAVDWSVRCYHEAKLHTEQYTAPDGITTTIPNTSVVTLTYNDDHLPPNSLLRHHDFQKFMKRVANRKQAKHKARRAPGRSSPPRMFMCGEYGGKTARPHYHSIIFGETFDDTYTDDYGVNKMSYELDQLWSQPLKKGDPPTNMGRATVDAFSFAAAGYVAGYIAKQQSPETLLGHFRHKGPTYETIQLNGTSITKPVAPEYQAMSPGLGRDWILKPENMMRVYMPDCIKISEWTFHPPKYYDRLLADRRPDLMGDILINRNQGMSKSALEWSPERCSAAEKIALSALQFRRDSL